MRILGRRNSARARQRSWLCPREYGGSGASRLIDAADGGGEEAIVVFDGEAMMLTCRKTVRISSSV